MWDDRAWISRSGVSDTQVFSLLFGWVKVFATVSCWVVLDQDCQLHRKNVLFISYPSWRHEPVKFLTSTCMEIDNDSLFVNSGA